MRHATEPKKRIFLLLRYTKLLLSIIFSNRNVIYLYITATIFSLVMLCFYTLFTAIRDGLHISESNWQIVVFIIVMAIVIAAGTSFDSTRITTRLRQRPNYPITRDTSEINRQLFDLYISRRKTSFILRTEALAAVLLVIIVSLVGTLEQQMLRTMSSIGKRFQKHSGSTTEVEPTHNNPRRSS